MHYNIMVEFCRNCDAMLTGKRCKKCGLWATDEQLERMRKPAIKKPTKESSSPHKRKKTDTSDDTSTNFVNPPKRMPIRLSKERKEKDDDKKKRRVIIRKK